MDIRLQYFDGCPNWHVADERLRDAMRKSGIENEIVYERIETPERATEARFRGSPTILFDGRDPFGEDDAPVGLSCRIFQTEAGPDGAPSPIQLAAILGQ
ncbi:MAG TPA: thioredoxin family protein [Acidimicrobiales bacterium]